MKIEVGDYTLNSDSMNLWITQKYQVKSKDGKPKTAERRVAGYCATWKELMISFARAGLKRSDANTMRQLMADVKKLADDAVMIGVAAREHDFKKG